jgi:hypothetical protein
MVATPRRGDEDVAQGHPLGRRLVVATPRRGDEDPRVKPQVNVDLDLGSEAVFAVNLR